MKEYFLFLKDKSIVFALVVLLVIEILLQANLYKNFLKKNSYASNVNRITDHALSKQSEIDPDILIVGTSLAYEGLSLRTLNETLKPLNLKAQTIAIPGAELIVQGLALEKVLSKFKRVKYIIHVNEIEMPWTLGIVFSQATLSMASELDRKRAIERFYEDEYKIGFEELSYIILRLWAYRKDIGEFILNPEKRIKDIGKSRKAFKENLYSYENIYTESLSLYKFKDLKECLKITKDNTNIALDSNPFHREAIFKTCKLAGESVLTLEENESTKLYRRRLDNFYKILKKRNIKVINVFPPISEYLGNFQYGARVLFWKEKYKDVLGEKIIDLTLAIPKENNETYFYDIVHVNKKGMTVFTEKLSDSLRLYFKERQENNAF
ncbi:MAG: SGNH/GDSL hydrolase family protein [Leptospiraceae bacterium]|nr:SGNH/GDSL hydrolase family protein [Leptospiraceae bacterium]